MSSRIASPRSIGASTTCVQGSATPGSYGAVTEIYGEGLRLPPVRLYSKGEVNAGLEAVIFANRGAADDVHI